MADNSCKTEKSMISSRVTQTIITEQGHKYSGELRIVQGKAGLRQEGRGSMIYTNGDVYTGEWLDNKRCGHGTIKYADGRVYEGEWDEDAMTGCGHLVYPTGDQYEGCFAKNQRNGVGVEVTVTTKEKYTGHFKSDARDGKGVLELANGVVYEGTFAAGVMSGKGNMRFLNGDSYEGSFQNNVMHGKGTYIFACGDRYTGDYVQGVQVGGTILSNVSGASVAFAATFNSAGLVRSAKSAAMELEHDTREGSRKEGTQTWKQGSGRITYACGDVYTGEFCDNKRQGNGVMVYATKSKYEGQWVNDDRSCEGIMTWNDQSGDLYREGDMCGWRYEGQWYLDKPEGHGTMQLHPTGVYKGCWLKGLRHGLGRDEVNGEVYEGPFVRGRRHGTNGMLKLESGAVIQGQFEDGFCVDSNGKIKETNGDEYIGHIVGNKREGEGRCVYHTEDVYEGEWSKDMRCGVGMQFFANGEQYVGTWKLDQMSGLGKMMYTDGSFYEGKFVEGLKHGVGVWFDAMTQAKYNVVYKNNELKERTPI